VIKFLHNKDLKRHSIAAERLGTDAHDAYERPNRKYCMYQLKLGRTDLITQCVGRRSALDDIDAAIHSLLRQLVFASVRLIAEALGILMSTISCHLVEMIGFENQLLRRMSHVIAEDPRQKRVGLSQELLPLLRSQQRAGFHEIVTMDVSWFLHDYEH
jgi:hypothetical protein